MHDQGRRDFLRHSAFAGLGLDSLGGPASFSGALVAFGATSDTVFAGDWLGRVHRLAGKSKKLSSQAPLMAEQ